MRRARIGKLASSRLWLRVKPVTAVRTCVDRGRRREARRGDAGDGGTMSRENSGGSGRSGHRRLRVRKAIHGGARNLIEGVVLVIVVLLTLPGNRRAGLIVSGQSRS